MFAYISICTFCFNIFNSILYTDVHVCDRIDVAHINLSVDNFSGGGKIAACHYYYYYYYY